MDDGEPAAEAAAASHTPKPGCSLVHVTLDGNSREAEASMDFQSSQSGFVPANQLAVSLPAPSQPQHESQVSVQYGPHTRP